MKIFTIGDWDANSGLTNYATTWKITKKIDRSEVIVEAIESTKYVNNWSVNLEVPVGEIYYLHVLRHLKDSDGNVVAYNNWIGPKKLISDDTQSSEVLVNKTHISEPYISSLNVDFNNGLIIELDEPVSNVPVISTNYIVSDKSGRTVASSINDSINKLKIVFPNTPEVNFTTMDRIFVSVSFNGERSTLSPISKDSTSYVSELYTLEGNITNINVDGETIAYVTPKSSTFVAIDKASLLTSDKVFINDVVVDSGMVKIKSNNLKHDTTYVLSLDIKYINPNDNTTKVKTVEHFVSTAKESEYAYFSDSIEFKNEVKPLALDQDLFKDNEVVVSEQSVYGIIPMIRNGRIFLYKVDVDGEGYVLVKDTGITITGSMSKFEFLPYNRLLVFHNGPNGELLFKAFIFNPYTNNLTLLKEGNAFMFQQCIFTNSFALIGERYYMFLTDGSNKVRIKYLDIKTFDLVDYGLVEIPETTRIDRVTVQPIDYNKVAISLENSTDGEFVWIYDFLNDEITRGPSKPLSFRGEVLMGHPLPNGNVVYFRIYTTRTPHDNYLVLDTKELTITEHAPNLGTPNYFMGSVRYRSGEIDKTVKDSTGKEDIYRFY